MTVSPSRARPMRERSAAVSSNPIDMPQKRSSPPGPAAGWARGRPARSARPSAATRCRAGARPRSSPRPRARRSNRLSANGETSPGRSVAREALRGTSATGSPHRLKRYRPNRLPAGPGAPGVRGPRVPDGHDARHRHRNRRTGSGEHRRVDRGPGQLDERRRLTARRRDEDDTGRSVFASGSLPRRAAGASDAVGVEQSGGAHHGQPSRNRPHADRVPRNVNRPLAHSHQLVNSAAIVN